VPAATRLDFLYGLQARGVKLGLENMRQLAAAYGHPEKELKFIHVAGTNGKGTCCAVLESILRHAGYKTGLFTSPHLIRFHERIKISGAPIGDELLAEALERLEAKVNELAAHQTRVTFFEAVTGLALDVFRREKVDIVLWETGLGGRLDSTNVVTPECAVITGISTDHQQYLGNTLVEIAGEKAGIIKEGAPLVYHQHTEHPEINYVLEKKAMEICGSAVAVAPPADVELDAERWLTRFDGYELGLVGRSHAINAHLAVAVLEEMNSRGWTIPESAIRAGLRHVFWPGRFQRLRREPALIVDGAHNIQAIAAVLSTWEEVYGQSPGKIIFGCLEDKEIEPIIPLMEKGSRVTLVPLRSERGRPPESLAPLFHFSQVQMAASATEALKEEWEHPTAEGCLVVGSLFLAGETLATVEHHESD
jgi:dihydrofolate synthase/folylpolyglutamate synthase